MPRGKQASGFGPLPQKSSTNSIHIQQMAVRRVLRTGLYSSLPALIWWTKKKIMSFGFKRFLLMCIKHFYETQVTTQICYLAIMGHVRVGYLLISCWDDSMHRAPVFCQHEMSVSRFAFNELITLKYQLKGIGHTLCLFSCRDASYSMCECGVAKRKHPNPLWLTRLCTDIYKFSLCLNLG